MRLAIIRRRYNPFGGAERFIERIANKLTERGVGVTLITEAWKSSGAKNLDIIEVAAPGWTRTARFRSFQRAVQQAINIQITLGKPFDLIQSHERLTGVDIFRLGDGVHLAWRDRLQRESGRLRSLWLRNDPYHRAVIETERAMAGDPKLHYVANSRLVQRELKTYFSVPDERITLIPNGVDTQRFRPATAEEKEDAQKLMASRTGVAIPRDAFVICFVGSGFARKGVFQLIKASAAVKGCVLLICGKDKESRKAQALIAQLGVGDRVGLTGPLEDVRPLLWAGDAFALPSLYDPSSNAVLEALSCGLPTIVTKDVGMADEMVQANAALICERESESIAQAVEILINQAHRQSMASNAREFALGYDQDLVVERWTTFYQTIQHRRSQTQA